MGLKRKLAEGQVTLGSWITIPHPNVVEIMASAGFEWLVIDMEHTATDLSQAQVLISTIQANNMKALVRVSKNEEVIIKRVMDMGADGVVVPMIKNGAEAREAVDYVKYPPTGRRGVGLYRAQRFGLGFEEYKRWLEEEAVIIAQIEHIDAIRNLDEILAVPGIDGTIVGPYDLSGSMGHPGAFHREDVKEALEGFKTKCKASGKPLGFHVIPPDAALIREKIDEGYTFLAFSLDFHFLGYKSRDEMALLAETGE